MYVYDRYDLHVCIYRLVMNFVSLKNCSRDRVSICLVRMDSFTMS